MAYLKRIYKIYISFFALQFFLFEKYSWGPETHTKIVGGGGLESWRYKIIVRENLDGGRTIRHSRWECLKTKNRYELITDINV